MIINWLHYQLNLSIKKWTKQIAAFSYNIMQQIPPKPDSINTITDKDNQTTPLDE